MFAIQEIQSRFHEKYQRKPAVKTVRFINKDRNFPHQTNTRGLERWQEENYILADLLYATQFYTRTEKRFHGYSPRCRQSNFRPGKMKIVLGWVRDS